MKGSAAMNKRFRLILLADDLEKMKAAIEKQGIVVEEIEPLDIERMAPSTDPDELARRAGGGDRRLAEAARRSTERVIRPTTDEPILFANPYLRCALCDAWVDGTKARIGEWWILVPCGHQADYHHVCPTWSPVDGCQCTPKGHDRPSFPPGKVQ